MDYNFERWCQQVTDCVRFRPDRKAVAEELAAHYIDHMRDLQRIGFDQKLAQERALGAMGDPLEVGRAMDKAHKPWLGWLWRVSHWILIGALALLAVSLLFGDIVGTIIERTHGQLVMEQAPPEAVEVDLGEYTLWYDPVLEIAETEEGFDVAVTLWIETATPWTGEPLWAWRKFQFFDDRGELSDPKLYQKNLVEDWYGSSWTRYGTSYHVLLDHCPEWLELRYPYGAEPWAIRVERGDTESCA